jgi:arabinose-5-phosphate isomerase
MFGLKMAEPETLLEAIPANKIFTEQDIPVDFYTLGIEVIQKEAEALLDLSKQINQHSFNTACSLIFNNRQGRVIVLGVGKSGHVGAKIAATLSSTGTPAFFVHGSEAGHGDMGMITKNDIVLAISYSGQSSEIVNLLPLLKRLNITIIAITGNKISSLAKAADVHLDISVKSEACPLNLAPTTSTTAALAMGDALAIALLSISDFSKEDFALKHPSGALGRKLILTIDDIWHTGDNLPKVNETSCIKDAIIEVSNKKLGMTCVTRENGEFAGIYTDGDLRRSLNKNIDINTVTLTTVMTPAHACQVVAPGLLAHDALVLMRAFKITALVVIDSNLVPVAVVHLHDILQAGVVA